MIDEKIKYWIDISDYDITVAESLLEKGHYLYVGFMCHQSVEKMLKAIYVMKFKTLPPFTHKLDKLIEMVSLKDEIPDELTDTIDTLTPLNIQARYPSYKNAIYKMIDLHKATEILSATKRLLIWLKEKIQ